MRVLILYANPKGGDKLKLIKEIRRIQDALEWAKVPDLKFDSIGLVKKSDLQTKLQHYKPDIVQISGHMTEEGELVLEGKGRQPDLVSPNVLESVFENNKGITCVLLNSCFSEKLTKAISKHVDYVIGMKKEIWDKSARFFSAKFYQSLGTGLSIQQAFDMAKTEIGLLDEASANLPTLVPKRGSKPAKAFLIKKPTIKAKFANDDTELDENDCYELEIEIENAPSGTIAVVYQYMDDYWDFEDQVEERTNAKANFIDDLQEDGNIEIRATLWTVNGGIAINTMLYDALVENYGTDPEDEEIAEAMKDIKKH